MEREQIIKALECCTNAEQCCDDCILLEDRNCGVHLLKNALSLIKELTEENERLIGAVKQYEEERKYHFEMSRKLNADTVRKMQERLKQAICDNTYPDFNKDGKPINVWKATTGYDVIDQIAKEMVEG